MFEFLNKSIVYSQGTHTHTHTSLGVLILTPGYLRPVHVQLGEPVSHPYVSCSAASFCLPFCLRHPVKVGYTVTPREWPHPACPGHPGLPQRRTPGTRSFSPHLPTHPYPVSLNILWPGAGLLDSPEYLWRVFLPLPSIAGDKLLFWFFETEPHIV